MDKQEEIDLLRNDPEILASIREGLHDAHLGHMFNSKLVFKSMTGTNDNTLSRWFYRSIVNLKKLWWILKVPWQRLITHRNCSRCKEYRNGK